MKVDFLHSVLGEATDHLSQSEVDELNKTLGEAQAAQSSSGSRGFDSDGGGGLSNLTGLLSQIPGAGELSREAGDLQAASEEQERVNQSAAAGGGSSFAPPPYTQTSFAAPPGSTGGPPGPGVPGMGDFNPQETIKKIYPILQFRDKVVRMLNATIEKIPGLESLVEKITETVTLFVMNLLAPFIRPIITAITKQVKTGSGTMVDASGKHQYEPWTDPYCTDPTHSLLSKDHFANILNEPAGQVATMILQYVAPRVIYAWQHPDISIDQVTDDVLRAFHHPALRNNRLEIHNNMYQVVERWARGHPDCDRLLSSESVKTGKNLTGSVEESSNSHFHGGIPQLPTEGSVQNTFAASLNSQFGSILKPFAKFTGQGAGFGSRDMGVEDELGTQTAYDNVRPPTGPEYPQQPAYEPQRQQQQEYGGYGGGGGYQEEYQPPAGPPPGQHHFGYAQPQGEYESGYGQYQGGGGGQYEGAYGGYGGGRVGGGYEEEYQTPQGPPPGRGGYYGEQGQGQGGGGYHERY